MILSWLRGKPNGLIQVLRLDSLRVVKLANHPPHKISNIKASNQIIYQTINDQHTYNPHEIL